MRFNDLLRNLITNWKKILQWLLVILPALLLMFITTWVLTSEKNYSTVNIIDFIYIYLGLAFISGMFVLFIRNTRKLHFILTLLFVIVGITEIAFFKEQNIMVTYDQWIFQGNPSKNEVKTLNGLVQKYSGVCNVAQMECREITPYVPPVSGVTAFDRFNYQIQIPREYFNIYSMNNQVTIDPNNKDEIDVFFRDANSNVIWLKEIRKDGRLANTFTGKNLAVDQIMQQLIQPYKSTPLDVTSQTYNSNVFTKIGYGLTDPATGNQVRYDGYGIDLGDRYLFLLNQGVPAETFEKTIMSSFTRIN